MRQWLAKVIISAIVLPFLVTLDLAAMTVERMFPMRGIKSWLAGFVVCVAAWGYAYHSIHSLDGWVAVAVSGLYGQMPSPVLGVHVTIDIAQNLL